MNYKCDKYGGELTTGMTCVVCGDNPQHGEITHGLITNIPMETAEQQVSLTKGLEAQLQDASEEIRSLWDDMQNAIDLIDRGIIDGARALLKITINESEKLSEKQGF